MTDGNAAGTDSTGRERRSAPNLRQRAEEQLRARKEQDLKSLTPGAADRLLHELQVHQIELEMQNEELHRTQRELEASRARYFDLYDLAPVGYLTLSQRSLILEANLTAANLLGTNRAAVVGQPLTHFILPEDQDTYYRHRKRLVSGNSSQLSELRLVRPDGTHFWARLDTAVAQDEASAPFGYRVTISDISERKRAEDALQRAHDGLEQRVEERTAELTTANAELRQEVERRKQAEELLRRQNALFRRSLLASDHERRIIAYEIHDSLAQQLAGAALHFESSEQSRQKGRTPAAEEAFQEGLNILRKSQADARRLIRGVRPLTLDQSGVEVSLRNYFHALEDKPGPRIEFQIQVAFDRLQPLEENAIYRIVQEGVANARRHSRSERVRVEVVQQGDKIRIQIQDWGIGFEPEETGHYALGLEGIRERAKMLDGQADIQTAPGQGTCVTVDLPVMLPDDDE